MLLHGLTYMLFVRIPTVPMSSVRIPRFSGLIAYGLSTLSAGTTKLKSRDTITGG